MWLSHLEQKTRVLQLVCVPALAQHGNQTIHSTQTSNISCFWESQMHLDLIEAVDSKQCFSSNKGGTTGVAFLLVLYFSIELPLWSRISRRGLLA